MEIPQHLKDPWRFLTGGRTIDEQIEDVRRNNNHGSALSLRSFSLLGTGILMPKPKAANVIIFGCYLPPLFPLLLRDYLEILDLLGIDHTYLQNEFCCGAPMIVTGDAIEQEKAREAAKEFVQKNLDLAREKGATTLVYCCAWCAHLAKSLFPDEASSHVYYPDIVIEKLEKENMRVAPTVMGYFEGCHTLNSLYAPGISLDWGRYRRLLDIVEGLTLVDLPHDVCCERDSGRIVAMAEKNNLDTILCSCISCYDSIRRGGMGRVRTRFLPELLLQSLKGE